MHLWLTNWCDLSFLSLSSLHHLFLIITPWLCPFISQTLWHPCLSLSHFHLCDFPSFISPLSLFPPSHLLSFSSFSFQLPSIFLSLLFITITRSKNHPPPKSPKNSSSLEMDFISFDFSESESSIHICSRKKSSIKKKNPKNLILFLLILWAKMKFTSSGTLHLRLSLKLSKGDLWSLDGWLILNNSRILTRKLVLFCGLKNSLCFCDYAGWNTMKR